MIAGERRSLLSGLHVLALWAVAIVHPVFDLIGRAPEFLIAHRAGSAETILLPLVALLLPVPLLALVALIRQVAPRAATAALGGMLVLLLTALGIQVVKQAGVGASTVAIPIAAAAALGATLAYFRFAVVRSATTVLTIAVIAVPAVFLGRPEVRQLMKATQTLPPAPDAGTPGFLPAPVVLVVFDELPLVSLLDESGQVDRAFYPEMAAFAQDAVWFRNATTVHDYTRWALPAILTGRLPPASAVPTPADHPDTLFTLLRHTHRMKVFESVTDLCPRSVCPPPSETLQSRLANLLADLAVVLAYVLTPGDLHDSLPVLSGAWAGFVSVDPHAAERARGRSGSTNTKRLEPWRERWHRQEKHSKLNLISAFIDSVTASDERPTLYFTHTLLSHHPYRFLPTGQRHSSRIQLPGARPGKGIDDEWALAQNQQRQLLQTAFIDRVVGHLMNRLKAVGIYDDSLIVLSSDHGVSFQPHEPLRNFTEGNAAEIMRIPLFIKFPSAVRVPIELARRNQLGQRYTDRNAEAIDIAPTVMHVLGLPPPPRAEGASLLDVTAPERPTKRIAFEGGKSLRVYGSEGPSLERVLRRKVETFNGPSNVRRIPRPPRFGRLIGRPVREFEVATGSAAAQVHDLAAHAAYDPSSETVPLGVSGRIRGRTLNSPPVHVAVAMNGVIHAVTRTWLSNPDRWLATPPPEAWRAGHNDIEVFEIDGSARSVILRRLFRFTARPRDLNLISQQASTEWSVRLRGFYAVEQARAGAFRWTRPHASLSIPTFGHTPTALRLRIIRTAVPDSVLTIAINGCTLFKGAIPRRDWDRRFSLESCGLEGDRMTVDLSTDKSAKGRNQDRRSLGMAVREIQLE